MDFGLGSDCKQIEAPVEMDDFNRFEREFARFVAQREAIYRAIPGGATWDHFEPPREKILEYYLTLKALPLNSRAVYLDAASCLSLFPNYVREATGAKVIRQDMFYPAGAQVVKFPRVLKPGFLRKTIKITCAGGDACAMPLADESASAIAMHCSLEHFEGDADSRFAKEAYRLLRPSGRLFIIPFYCGDKYTEIIRGENAPGCQFQRYYDPPSFRARVLDALPGPYHVEMRYYRNMQECDPSFYCYYSVCIVKGSVQ